MKPLLVVTDFNQTLVRERTLPTWCRDQVRAGSAGQRARALLRCGTRGLAAIALDLVGDDAHAALVGLGALTGSVASELERWARTRLSLNPRAERALSALERESASLSLTVVSRGSPGIVVRAFLETVRERLPTVVAIHAPELEVVRGVITGRLTAPALAKGARASLLVGGAIYLGDRRDRPWASGDARFRFVDVSRHP